MISRRERLRVFPDSNVIMAGFLSAWGLDKAILSLCAARITRLVLADVVRLEVEENLLIHSEKLLKEDAEQLLSDYDKFLQLARPEIVPPPSASDVLSNRSLIRHLSDVPVLLSAITVCPDWFITHNTEHFTETVAKQTGVHIVTPYEFFRELTADLLFP